MIFRGKIYKILSAMAIAMVVTGCSYVEDPGNPCPKPDMGSDGNVHLNFMMTSDAKLVNGTRFDDQNHPETGSDLDLEETINTNDFAFYIFLGKAADGVIDWDNAPLLYANYDINHSTDPYTMITGSGGSYNVTVTLPTPTFEKILGRSLDPESNEAVNFRIVLLANSTGGYGSGITNYEKIEAIPAETTYGEVIAASEKIYMESSSIHEASFDNLGDTSDGVIKGYIPMYGNIFTPVTEKDLCSSRPFDGIFLGNVFMLRSFAKVRIHDNIREKKDEFPRLHSAILTYTTPNAYMLPADAASYLNGTQVHAMRECKENSWNIAYGGETSLQLPFISGKRKILIGYLPEQTIGTEMPNLEIRIQISPFDAAESVTGGDRLTYKPNGQEDLEKHTRKFIVPMSGYKGTAFTWGSQILRNHIYDLNVDFKDGTELTLAANVKDWDQTRLELDFQQNPMVPQPVRWTDGTYASVNAAQGQIFLKPWDSESNRVAAECTFEISAPKGARWTAYLIPAGGAPGSFMFKVGSDAQGDILEETVSGNTGTPAHLHIVSVDPNPTQNNSAILQVIVGMDGGTRFMEAPVAGGTVKNWTINQARQ